MKLKHEIQPNTLEAPTRKTQAMNPRFKEILMLILREPCMAVSYIGGFFATLFIITLLTDDFGWVPLAEEIVALLFIFIFCIILLGMTAAVSIYLKSVLSSATAILININVLCLSTSGKNSYLNAFCEPITAGSVFCVMFLATLAANTILGLSGIVLAVHDLIKHKRISGMRLK